MNPYEDNTTNEIAKSIANRGGKLASRLALKLGKFITKKLFKLLLGILAKTAVVWVPLVAILLICYISFLMVYAIPRQAAEDLFASDKDKVSAFMGFSKDEEYYEENSDVFEKYKEIASEWDNGLSTNQKQQAMVHELSWAILASVDRLIHDPLMMENGESEINIDPENVFNDIKPEFEFKDSVIYIEEEVWKQKEKTIKVEVSSVDEDGNEVTETIEKTVKEWVLEVKSKTEEIKLLTRAETIEGVFIYEYKEIEEITRVPSLNPNVDTQKKTIKKEILNKVQYPTKYYEPFIHYLNKNGITRESDIELVLELSTAYDPNYDLNLSYLKNFDYSSYPRLVGANDWLWVTPSTRGTSPYGPRNGEFHLGIDIGAENQGVDGEPIWAMEDGTVTRAERSTGGYGTIVYIRHYDDQIETRYAHLETLGVSKGDKVKKGDLVGTMGNTGNSTGTHLHFEIRQDGKALDPAYFFPIEF
ncbi:M23 family metallopeptidase [Chengkuizengella sediminis]|uniref:M23 family metallopeptidase n=1 Tax=Chengkuizengella sediminis TaxID=1885917 RepID=UPI00138A29A4|nr:M23 family metallopeptidase [Chengkuizengella sediminis]NDI36650.1 peptidoglycan DD-metalloendopeptidase family protein [Chengkuizengella sediminis]